MYYINPKNLFSFGLIALFMMTSFVADAQIIDLDRIGKRAKRKVERKAERKVEDKIDDAIDGIFDKKKKKQDDEDEAYDATNEEEYSYEVDDSPIVANSFIGSYKMEVNTYKKGKLLDNQSSSTRFIFDTYKLAIQPQTEDADNATIIIDNKAKTMTTLTESEGKKQGFQMAKPKVKASSETSSNTDVKIKKTQETKTIEGYLCYKYLVTSDDFRTTAWVTEDIKVTIPFLPASAFTGTQPQRPQGADNVEGMALESYTVDNDGKEIKMSIKDLEVGIIDVSVFDTSDYNVIDMGSMSPYPGKN